MSTNVCAEAFTREGVCAMLHEIQFRREEQDATLTWLEWHKRMNATKYTSSLSSGSRVHLVGIHDDCKRGQIGTIVRILPNPSGKREHQWYDVRFDDGTMGRFLERYLIAQGKIRNDQLIDDVA